MSEMYFERYQICKNCGSRYYYDDCRTDCDRCCSEKGFYEVDDKPLLLLITELEERIKKIENKSKGDKYD